VFANETRYLIAASPVEAAFFRFESTYNGESELWRPELSPVNNPAAPALLPTFWNHGGRIFDSLAGRPAELPYLSVGADF